MTEKYRQSIASSTALYTVVEEINDDGALTIRFEMDPPVGQYSREVWSWTGRVNASTRKDGDA